MGTEVKTIIISMRPALDFTKVVFDVLDSLLELLFLLRSLGLKEQARDELSMEGELLECISSLKLGWEEEQTTKEGEWWECC